MRQAPAFWNPNITIRSAIQHFAAGAVLAAVASNVISEVERLGTLPGITGGFVAGVLVMIGPKWVVVRSKHQGKQKNKFPVGLAAAAAVDTLIDGTLICAGSSANAHLGFLLAIALAREKYYSNINPV